MQGLKVIFLMNANMVHLDTFVYLFCNMQHCYRPAEY